MRDSITSKDGAIAIFKDPTISLSILPGTKLADGKWYSISFLLMSNKEEGVLRVDDVRVEELEGEEIAEIYVRDYIKDGEFAPGYAQWKGWPKKFLDSIPHDGIWHCIEHSNISESYWIDGVQYPYVC